MTHIRPSKVLMFVRGRPSFNVVGLARFLTSNFAFTDVYYYISQFTYLAYLFLKLRKVWVEWQGQLTQD